ncbi:MAG: peptidase S1, partial [Treponema sp.]|nr:peptidase S1 [Treponema sp.]
MKLYSRGQVFFFSILSGLIVFLFALGTGLLGISPKTAGNRETAAETAAEEGAGKTGTPDISQGRADADPLAALNLRQSDYTSPQALNTAEVLPYTEDERENISIYERLNVAVV